MDEIEVSQTNDEAQFIREKLNEYNRHFAAPDQHERLCLVARKDGEIIGGLAGGTYWNWMYIELFWVDASQRNNGLGTRLLAKAEEIALRRGCKNVHLETHDFQSLAFYQRRNYVVFGELEDLPEGHRKYYLRKQLIKK
jgi:GNAT superfamily N-acetyltransferase